MNKKILIAPNSYKECADSVTASDFFIKNLTKLLSDYSFIAKPISDGGDGFLTVCQSNFDLKILEYQVTTAFDNSFMKCKVGYDQEAKVLFIESADVLGLKVIPKEKRRPIYLSSKGMGELLLHIQEDVENGKLEIEKISIGIGGTCTNDLGLGMSSIFGWKYLNDKSETISAIPDNFEKVSDIIGSKLKLPFRIEVITDVQNPLLGKDGATMVFGQQKGSTLEELSIIEKGFEKILNLIKTKQLCDLTKVLSGAGGGLAAGLQLFFDANIKTASEFLIDDLKLKTLREHVDYIITGEGAFDKQSLMKKGTGILLDIYKESKKKIFLCCGKIEESVKNDMPDNIYPIELYRYFNSIEESLQNFEQGINLACKDIATIIQSQNFIN